MPSNAVHEKPLVMLDLEITGFSLQPLPGTFGMPIAMWTNVFISKIGWQHNNLKGASPDTVSSWLKDIIVGKNIGINGIQSAFISYYWNKLNNNQKIF